jgi:hypothetical protein
MFLPLFLEILESFITPQNELFPAAFRIHDILVWIRIRIHGL